MTLSEKIIALRNKYNMSQGDLAEKLNVSRQSVSKWETGASTPDLDKLIAMSELFHVTLDELVKNGVEIGSDASKRMDEPLLLKENISDNATWDKMTKVGKRILPIVAGIMLVLFALIYVILWSLGLFWIGAMPAILIPGYALLCGLICIFSKKNAGRRILIITIGILVTYIVLLVLNSAIGVIY